MKSIKISLIISLSLICCLLKSQDSYVGVSSGLNISKFTSPALNLTDYKMGYDFNLFYEKKIIEHFDLGIGFDYHNIGSKGGKITYINNSGNIVGEGEDTWSNTYLSLPIFIKPYIGNKVKGYIKAGFIFSYLLKSEYSSSVGLNNTNSGEGFNKTDIGNQFAIGFDFPLGTNYYLGFETLTYLGYRYVDINNILKNPYYLLSCTFKYKIK